MHNETRLLAGGMLMLGLATSALVVLPYLLAEPTRPAEGLKPYTAAEQRGRAAYIRHGCVACHSQQPRARNFAPDAQRGWGRASVAGDYAYDTPPLLGTMRTGPDLLNIGARQPSASWHLGHLYQPRAYVPGSIMPSYPFLFETKAQPEPGDVEVALPPGARPAGRTVVATPEALDLVAYLKALDRTYPALPGEKTARAR
ncbi:MAG: cbb3-type cytochrome c oxidase subunit II [Piscinibacter sp.]|nr:cbb3-type cytochrome c oxidase subunit II [Piscinibacter sp.]